MTDRLAKADLNPVRQRTQYTCMSTSMMMCLQALGHNCDEDEVNRVMGARPMKGAAWEQALACAQHYGVRGTLVTPSTVNQLKEWTDAGKPVMIAWNPEGREWSHASVVFDVDDDLNVYVADPNIPDPDETVRVVPKGEFYKKWYEKWPNYLVRRPALMLDREITSDGRQVMASNKRVASAFAAGQASAPRIAERYRQAVWLGKPEMDPSEKKWTQKDLSRKPSADEIKAAKNTSWQDWSVRPLLDDLDRYFKRTPNSVEVPLSLLTPIRAREKGVANANRFMWLAYWGATQRRKPISLQPNPEGSGDYMILDGNSTYANARMSGWDSILAEIEE